MLFNFMLVYGIIKGNIRKESKNEQMDLHANKPKA